MTTVTSDPNSLFMTTVTTDSFVSPIGSASIITSTGTAPSSSRTVTESSTSPIAFGSTGTHRPSTIPNQHTMATTKNTTLVCPEPSSIVGGSTISRGPYAANISSVVFSCYAGYSLSGPAQVVCNAAGDWASKFPQCVPISNHPKVDNHLTFNQDSGAVPFWLLIVLAVVLGLLCLLLITCLLLFCLKLFGCWKGGLCFRSKLGSARRVHDSEIFRDDFSQRDAYRSKRTHYEDEERNTRSNRNSEFGTQTTRISKETTEPAVVRGWDVNKLRREARMPAKLTWMPHSNSIRHYNTSTK